MKESFATLLKSYFAEAAKRLVAEHKKLRKTEKRNHEIQMNRGDLNDEEKQDYEKLLKSYEKLISNMQTYECLPLCPLCPAIS